MTTDSKYRLDPEIRAKILASLPPARADSEKLSEAEFFEIVCDLPDVIGIKQGMSVGAVVDILEREGKDASEKFGQTWHNQIFDSTHKITLLKQEIESQEALIREANKHLKRLKSKGSSENRGRGRPKKSLIREESTKQLMAKWIRALQTELEVTTCSKLEDMINETGQRNWQHWLSGKAVPTSSNFLKLMSAEILKGKHAGKVLADIPTPAGAPSARNLFNLICQDQFVEEGVWTF